jgi:hypothetical protein
MLDDIYVYSYIAGSVCLYDLSNRITASRILSFTSSFARSRFWFHVPSSFNLCTLGGGEEDTDWIDLIRMGRGGGLL